MGRTRGDDGSVALEQRLQGGYITGKTATPEALLKIVQRRRINEGGMEMSHGGGGPRGGFSRGEPPGRAPGGWDQRGFPRGPAPGANPRGVFPPGPPRGTHLSFFFLSPSPVAPLRSPVGY